MPFSVQNILEFLQASASTNASTSGRVVNASALKVKLEEIQVKRLLPLKGAESTDLAFFFSRAFESELPFTKPGVLIVGEPFVKPMEAAGLPFWSTTAVIACADPYLAMALLSKEFAAELSPGAHVPALSQGAQPEVHPTAVVHPSAELASGVTVGAHCVVEAFAKIGVGSVLYPGCFIGKNAVLGEHCVLFPRVVVYDDVRIGKRVRIHAGTVLGADGFGYAPVVQDKQVVNHQKIYHLGRVVIEDDVEIGANSTVDRATLGETRIGKNAKLDNLVHVGHNARVDEGGILCGGVCLAGNAHVGKYAYVGGLTGVINHVHIGDGAKVAALSLVSKDIPAGGTAVGNPQRTHRDHFRAHAHLSKQVSERRKK